MTPRDMRDLYLMKAKEADEEADKAPDGRIRQTWQAIAQNYRKLADSVELPPGPAKL